MSSRQCYIARYPLRPDGKGLQEEILFRDTYYSPAVAAEWDRLVALRDPNFRTEPMLQCWYSGEGEVHLMCCTNQPFILPP